MQQTVAAIYCRLSKEDLNCDTSESINNQMLGINEYAKENNIIVYKVYSDDGYSGGNFERPAFKEMMQDLSIKKFNTIIIKDLSRLGREYIGVGNLVENVFPLNKIRLISINDNYDSLNYEDDYSIVLRSLLNDYYLKECKRKSQQAVMKRSKTKYMTTGGIYGYKYGNDKELIIDEKPANVVRYIFNEYISLTKVKIILNYLNSNHIPTPGYQSILNYGKNRFRVKEENYFIWTREMITKILNNIEYTGVAINRNVIMHNGKQIKNPNPEIIYDSHPAIITKETFDKAQEILHSKTPKIPNDLDKLRFKGLFYCKECDKLMHYIRGNNPSYICKNNHRIKADTIHKVVFVEVKRTLAEFIKNPENFKKKAYEKLMNQTNEKRYIELINRKNEIDAAIEKLFLKKIEGEITVDAYKDINNELLLENKEIENKLQSFKNIEVEKKLMLDRFKEFQSSLMNLDETNEFEKVKRLVSKIEVNPITNKVKISYIFSRP